MRSIDLNCDLGELIDGTDLAMMPYISSCNIACGGHAGSVALMERAIDEAKKYQVVIGAHPGYPDKANFGRISWDLSDSEIKDLIATQVNQLQLIGQKKGTSVRYVKLHGALYHDAANEGRIAKSVVDGVREVSDIVGLLGPEDSILEQTAISNGFEFFKESFVDRRYLKNNQLVPRSEPNSILNSLEEIEEQLLDIVVRSQVKTQNGKFIQLIADSICVHGDHPNSLKITQRMKSILEAQGVTIKPFID